MSAKKKLRAAAPRTALALLRELDKYFSFDAPIAACIHDPKDADSCCCGFTDPTEVNALFERITTILRAAPRAPSPRRTR